MTKRIYLFDTTLRDGAQSQGVDFSVDDKRAIARALDGLNIDYVEGGWPGANPVDDDFFARSPNLNNAIFTAFGMTRRPGHSAANDPGLNALLTSAADAVCMVGKTWDFHVDVALGISQDENIAMISDSVAHARTRVSEALFDAEHFFDGYKANPEFALACLQAALDAGARWVVLCDTNGGTLPYEVSRIVGEVIQHIPGDHLGIHAHDDTGNAVANSLAAVEAGARQVQGTLNGLGERCGNANLVTVIPNLMLKYDGAYETGLGEAELGQLAHVSRLLDELLNRAPDRHAAYVGEAAFAHKGGLHVSAVQKDPRTYEHIEPGIVGNSRHIVVSDQAGRSNILVRLAEAGIEIDAGDKRINRLVEDVKAREYDGYSYDGAEASFEILARRALGEVPRFYDVQSFRTEVERRFNARGDLTTISQAVMKIDVGGEPTMQVAEGNGPVNALDAALRKALLPKFPELESMRLVDFKVRILAPQQATAAVTRVMIESTDETGHRWGTVGISPNIIDAAYAALDDAIVYKLLRARNGA
ncbi:MAG: citramalate synthase [Alphaproteobacteria bacterium]|nr:citramalate synthase [Alphaproteobacteria bacterium]